MNTKSIYGIFDSRASVANAIDELKAAKFSSSDLKILFSPPANDLKRKVNDNPEINFLPGIMFGGIFGCLICVLTGVNWDVQILPRIAGDIVSGAGRLAILGAIIGIVIAGLVTAITYFISLQSQRQKSNIYNSGGFLILADASNPSLADNALKILKRNDAKEVSISSI